MAMVDVCRCAFDWRSDRPGCADAARRRCRRYFDRRHRAAGAGGRRRCLLRRAHSRSRQARRGDDSARRAGDRRQGQDDLAGADRRPLPLLGMARRALSRLRRDHLPRYQQQPDGMDHFAEGRHSERQDSRPAAVDFRPRARWAAAAGDAGAALAARQYHRSYR